MPARPSTSNKHPRALIQYDGASVTVCHAQASNGITKRLHNTAIAETGLVFPQRWGLHVKVHDLVCVSCQEKLWRGQPNNRTMPQETAGCIPQQNASFWRHIIWLTLRVYFEYNENCNSCKFYVQAVKRHAWTVSLFTNHPTIRQYMLFDPCNTINPKCVMFSVSYRFNTNTAHRTGPAHFLPSSQFTPQHSTHNRHELPWHTVFDISRQSLETVHSVHFDPTLFPFIKKVNAHSTCNRTVYNPKVETSWHMHYIPILRM